MADLNQSWAASDLLCAGYGHENCMVSQSGLDHLRSVLYCQSCLAQGMGLAGSQKAPPRLPHGGRALYCRRAYHAEDHCLLSATALNLKRMIKHTK